MDDKDLKDFARLVTELQRVPKDYQARQLALEAILGQILITLAQTMKIMKEVVLARDTEAMDALAISLESPEEVIDQMLAVPYTAHLDSLSGQTEDFSLAYVNTFYHV